MDRRTFNRNLAALAGTALLGPAVAAQPVLPPDRPELAINGERLNDNLQELSVIGLNAEGGCDRVAFSVADLEGRALVAEFMAAAGLQTRIDVAGNLIGWRAGRDPDRAPIVLGSHIDSVPNGGHYDGPLGVLAAIEVAQTLEEHHMRTIHPLEIVAWSNEEGGKTGSRALIGAIRDKEFELVSHSGRTIGEGIRFIGGDPDRIAEARRRPGSIAGYLELHIEQGAILDNDGITIGVVEGIVGIKRWTITVEGFANHAGTTPMNARHDAMLVAADVIKGVNTVITGTEGRQVGTVGRIRAYPGAPNVVPGKVEMSLEIRDLDMEKIDKLFQEIEATAAGLATTTETEISFDHFYTSHAAKTDPLFQQVIAKTAGDMTLSSHYMPSGAGHDAQSIAPLAPIGMVFIPSIKGISHSPMEFSGPGEITAGANVLMRAMLELDDLLP